MTTDIKPIKRSPQLVPLSREHHDGLLFVWKIRRGLENKTPLEQLRSYALWYWRNHIKAHFFQEEKILLPSLSPDHPLALRLKEDHDHIRELILGLDDEADERTLAILCDLIVKHIRFEEREFFGYLEKLLPVDVLNKISQQLEEHPVKCDSEWKDEFWVK